MSFSAWFIPLLITGLFSWGLCSGVDVFDCFLQGAKEGLKTAASIAPALVCLLTVVTMFCHSGALDVLTGFLRPVTQLIGFPAEVLPLALLRPSPAAAVPPCCTSCWGNTARIASSGG